MHLGKTPHLVVAGADPALRGQGGGKPSMNTHYFFKVQSMVYYYIHVDITL